MVGCGLLTATLLCLPAGCTSDRDRRLKEYRQMHRDIREERMLYNRHPRYRSTLNRINDYLKANRYDFKRLQK